MVLLKYEMGLNNDSGVGPSIVLSEVFIFLLCTLLLPSSQANKVSGTFQPTSIKIAVYKPQLNGQLVVVVLTSAAIIINPITFLSAPLMKVKVIRGCFGCLGNRNKCSTPPREHSLPSCLAPPRTFHLLGVHQSLKCSCAVYPSPLPHPYTSVSFYTTSESYTSSVYIELPMQISFNDLFG